MKLLDIYNTSFTWYIFGGFAFLCTATKHSLCIPYKENIVQYANLLKHIFRDILKFLLKLFILKLKVIIVIQHLKYPKMY